MTAAPTLVQIRHGYRAESQGLSFAVETEAGEWILTVRNCNGATEYRAEQSTRRAAQSLALDFAAFQGVDEPLKWQEYW
jgi:hypothetical protein